MTGREPAGARRRGVRTEPARASLRIVHPPEERRTRKDDDALQNRRSLFLLLVPAAALTVVGLVMVLSAGSISAIEGYGTSFWYFERQSIYAVVGLVGLVVAMRLPYTVWKRFATPMLVAVVPLMLLTFHSSTGTSLYGASRWIDVGPVTVQPSEFAKIALIAFTAGVLAAKRERIGNIRDVLLPLAPVVMIIAGIVILQRDLGTALILCGSVFLLLFAAGVRLRHLAVIGASGLLATALLIFGEAYRRTRFLESFVHPWTDPKGAGYQLVQGLIALGSGGWFGVGLGASRQKWGLPNAHSDFIFAIIGEELGLLGALVVLLLFAFLLYAGIRIAVRAPTTFGRLLASGITSWIALQTVINLGAVTGLLPITGVPLPLVSFGGTALVVTLTGIGILANLAGAGVTPGGRKPASRPGASPARKAKA
ncbi:MAG: putative lipid II flippase FtsW [Actinomycetota bacterium]|nr:putative lipid II flippase FtsW [Actinomycetota bacterium]